MVPLVELRGAVPVGIGMDLPVIPTILVSVLGNLLPVPFIYMFARKFLLWGSNRPRLGRFCRFFLVKGEQIGQQLTKKKGRWRLIVALILFVGIPLPGTGAWNGTLAASFLNMGRRATALAVTLGAIMAGTIMAVVSMLGLHIFGM